MIDTFNAKTGSKKLYVKVNGITVVICDGKTAAGKWHVIDVAMGDTNAILNDLREQGYQLTVVK